MDRDFEIAGRSFKLNKLDPFKQFHIVRRLGPILGDIIPVAQKIKSIAKDDATEDEKFQAMATLAAPVMTGFAKLSDEDSNFVLMSLCSAAEVKQETGNWARVASNGTLMMGDLDLPQLLQIAGRAFAYNLSGFFSIAPQISHGRK